MWATGGVTAAHWTTERRKADQSGEVSPVSREIEKSTETRVKELHSTISLLGSEIKGLGLDDHRVGDGGGTRLGGGS